MAEDMTIDRPDAAELGELEASAAAATRLMKLLANEQRLILLCRLIEGECSVGDLADYVGLAQSAASQHLAKLRAEGVVATRREAQTIFYRIVDPAATRMIDTLCEIYRGKPVSR
ncbi:metalloregulator ArsR/SmtB family transcription factor [Caulobacter sp. NIBR1757]|uniref:ArsR/SmtB family transcription factor n=1 Tax=Caulobacter sp. NIBR1757 TaxID=3016000 RepID=UPI0022F0C096|nr:metalloregulator ArsR/SmtB family transcription factor [Caulobacter sp. NIBR1757]WGM37663.1 Transcriptional activator HlyU [Caulobacter sp. NIBR1757]